MTWLRTRSEPPDAASSRSLRRYTSQCSAISFPSAPVVFGRSFRRSSSFSSSSFTNGSGSAGPWNWQSERSSAMLHLRDQHEDAERDDLRFAKAEQSVQ